MMMKTQSKAKHEEGGTPTHGGPKGGKGKRWTMNLSQTKTNMTTAGNRRKRWTMNLSQSRRNETPQTVPVKSTKQ
jgi:hypothetical protein